MDSTPKSGKKKRKSGIGPGHPAKPRKKIKLDAGTTSSRTGMPGTDMSWGSPGMTDFVMEDEELESKKEKAKRERKIDEAAEPDFMNMLKDL